MRTGLEKKARGVEGVRSPPAEEKPPHCKKVKVVAGVIAVVGVEVAVVGVLVVRLSGSRTILVVVV